MIVNLQSQYLIAFFLLINLLNKCLDLKQNIAIPCSMKLKMRLQEHSENVFYLSNWQAKTD